ncbi:MAG: hypothetical protein ACREJO_02030 [Phycisphaerales bacterium]
MTRSTLAAAGLSLLALAPMSLAQIVPPAPAATTPAAPYTPPPPPPPAPQPQGQPGQPAGATPAGPAITPPNLVQKDAAGIVTELTVPAEFAAVDGLNLPADRKAKVDAVKLSRRAMMDGTCIQRCTDASMIYTKLPNLEKIEFNDLVALQKPLQSLVLKPPFIDMLVQQGALTSAEGDACRAAVNNYNTAMQKMLKEQGGNNIMMIAGQAARMNIRGISREAIIAFDDMLTKAAAKTGKSKEELAATLGAADAETQQRMLVPVATPMPMTIEPVKEGAKPAEKPAVK